MNRMAIIISFVLMTTTALYVYAEKEDDEGVSDNPNHASSIELTREKKRISREADNVYNMLMDIFNDKKYMKDHDYYAEKSKDNLKQAHEAWKNYQKKETDLETQLFGPAHQGYPGGDEYNLCEAELFLEHIARMRKVLEKILIDEELSSPKGELTLKIKLMIDKIKEFEIDHGNRLRKISE